MTREVAEVLAWLDGARAARLVDEVEGLRPHDVRRIRQVVAELPDQAEAWGAALTAILVALGAGPDVVEAARQRGAAAWRPQLADPARPPWALRVLGGAVVAAPPSKVPAIALDAVDALDEYLARTRKHGAAGVRLLLLVAEVAVRACDLEVEGGWTALQERVSAHGPRAARELVVEGKRVGLWTHRVRHLGDGTDGRPVRIVLAPGEPLAEQRRPFAPLPGPHDRPPLVGGRRGHGPQWAMFALAFPALRPLARDALDHGGAFDLPALWWRDLAERAGLPFARLDDVRTAYVSGGDAGDPVLVSRTDGRYLVGPVYADLGYKIMQGAGYSVRASKGGRARAAKATRLAGRYLSNARIDA